MRFTLCCLILYMRLAHALYRSDPTCGLRNGDWILPTAVMLLDEAHRCTLPLNFDSFQGC